MDVETRPMTEQSLGKCAALYVSVFNAAPWNDHWTYELAERRLSETLATPGSSGLLALQGGKAVGFLVGYRETWYTGIHYYLKEMCVRTDLQRLGIGSHLFARLKTELQSEGVERIYLLTMQDSPAEAFYARQDCYRSPKMGLQALRLGRKA